MGVNFMYSSEVERVFLQNLLFRYGLFLYPNLIGNLGHLLQDLHFSLCLYARIQEAILLVCSH